MNRLTVAATGGIAVLAGLAYFASRPTQDMFDKMSFPHGLSESVGDPQKGRVCHQVRYRGEDGTDDLVVSHNLWNKDFRTMTESQKAAVLIEDSRKDWNEHGGTLACADPEADPSGVVSVAYAQKHNPGGGGCDTISCPAHIATGGGCILGGPNCVITFVCCGAPCTC